MSSTVDLLADIRASDNELTLAELLATGGCAGRQMHIVFCTLFAYTQLMNATFVELPAFARYRSGYLEVACESYALPMHDAARVRAVACA